MKRRRVLRRRKKSRVEKYVLACYVTGQTPRSLASVENLRAPV
jgi:hypothetical protein